MLRCDAFLICLLWVKDLALSDLKNGFYTQMSTYYIHVLQMPGIDDLAQLMMILFCILKPETGEKYLLHGRLHGIFTKLHGLRSSCSGIDQQWLGCETTSPVT